MIHRTVLLVAGCILALHFSFGQEGASAILTSGESAHVASTVKDLTPAELSAMLASPTVFVFDCNEPDMHAEAHVPGAKPIVYDEVTIEKLPPDHNATLVFYCYSPECPAAAAAARSAIALGFTDVRCMSAGIIGWQDAGLHTEP